MGVVRREGDWRLEKHDEGVYEVTFQREPQVKILTADAPPHTSRNDIFESVPVRNVETFNEAEGLFEEKAHGPPPLGANFSTQNPPSNSRSSAPLDIDSEIDLDEVPPVGIGLGFLFAGAFSLYAFRDVGNSLVLLFGIGFVLIGLLPFVYAGYLFREEEWQPAWDFLLTVEGDGDSNQSSSDDTEKTPPAPEKLKNRLIFDRAGQQCEWCDEQYDHLQVHHIEPRREGGPNDPANLIVLCPNCHENADRGAISRSKLRAKVNRLPDLPPT